MSMKKFMNLALGIGLITFILSIAVIMRPVWKKLEAPLESTVTHFGVAEATAVWTSLSNTVNNNFWLIPVVAVILVVGWIFMTMQRKEIVTGGYYG